MLLAMATILMLQLRSFNLLFLVASVAPLALIGVVLALLLSNSPWVSWQSWVSSHSWGF